MTPNDLHTTSSNVPHTWITALPESQISLHFTLQPAVFELQAILRQVRRMTQNWHWTLQGQIYPYMYNYFPWTHIVLYFTQQPAIFTIHAILRQVHRMTPKWPWTPHDQLYSYMRYYHPRVPRITLFHSTTSHFRVAGHFETSAPSDPKLTLNPTR